MTSAYPERGDRLLPAGAMSPLDPHMVPRQSQGTMSIPSTRPLDPGLTEVLRRIDAVCISQALPYLLTGAMAREILLVHGLGLPPGRATRDVDFGVLVKTWAAFDTFRSALLETRDFLPDPSVQHRIYSVSDRLGFRMPVDLVPFGGLEAPKGCVAWPPQGEVVMDVRGYEVAHLHALRLEIQPGLVIPLPSAEGILVMKTLAWKDRGNTTQGRDAIDLVEILERAEAIIDLEVLYDEHMNVVEAWGGDLRLAGAWVLGVRTRSIAGEKLAAELAAILDFGLIPTLIPQVLRGHGAMHSVARYEAIEGIVRAFISGLQNHE